MFVPVNGNFISNTWKSYHCCQCEIFKFCGNLILQIWTLCKIKLPLKLTCFTFIQSYFVKQIQQQHTKTMAKGKTLQTTIIPGMFVKICKISHDGVNKFTVTYSFSQIYTSS